MKSAFLLFWCCDEKSTHAKLSTSSDWKTMYGTGNENGGVNRKRQIGQNYAINWRIMVNDNNKSLMNSKNLFDVKSISNSVQQFARYRIGALISIGRLCTLGKYGRFFYDKHTIAALLLRSSALPSRSLSLPPLSNRLSMLFFIIPWTSWTSWFISEILSWLGSIASEWDMLVYSVTLLAALLFSSHKIEDTEVSLNQSLAHILMFTLLALVFS